MEKKLLTLVAEALRVGHTGKGCQTPTKEVNMGWLRPPVIEKLMTGLHTKC